MNDLGNITLLLTPGISRSATCPANYLS